MGHNDYIRPDGQWPPELVLTPSDQRAFDVAQYQALNAGAGGAWTPATPVTLGGQGLQLTGGLHQLLGMTTKSGGRVVLANNDMPTFKTAASRAMRFALLDPSLFLLFSLQAPVQPFFACSLVTPGTVFSSAMPQGTEGVLFPIPKRYLHNGATLASATARLAIGQVHAALPAQQPSVWIIRSDYAYGPLCLPFVADTTFFATPSLWVPTTANGYFYAVTTTGTGGSEPAWPTTVGATVTTGSVTFTCAGTTWASSGYPNVGNPALWQASHAYAAGMPIQPSPATGQWFVASTGGTTGASQPTWPKTLGASVSDGGVTWLGQGSMLPLASGQLAAGSASAYYAGGAQQSLALAAVTGGPTLIDNTAFSYGVLVFDESGSGSLTPSLNLYASVKLFYAAIADMGWE